MSFEVPYEFELAEDITIPANCVLLFNGGSISNGTLTGNDTIINDAENIFDNIVISGTWIAPIIRVSMFKQSSNILKQIQSLMNSNIHNDVFIDKDCAAVFPQVYNGTAFNVCCNSDVYIIKNITANDLVNNVSLINVDGDNINIIGGTIIGPKDNATAEQSSWEWEHGITVSGKNVTIKNVSISKFMGDGIYINSSNVTVEGCDISYVNRNGISVTDNSPYDINLIGNYIHNISGGVLNMSIDFEPNSGNINNCAIKNNIVDGIQLISCKNISLENNTGIIIVNGSEEISITNSDFYKLVITNNSNQVKVENNKIRVLDVANSKNIELIRNTIDAAANIDISGNVNISKNLFKLNGSILYINKGTLNNNIIFNNNTFDLFYLGKRSETSLSIDDTIKFYNNTFNCGNSTINVGSSPYLIFEDNTFNVSSLDAYLITPSSGGLSLYKNNIFILDPSITVGRICGVNNSTLVFVDNTLVTSIRAISCYAKFSYVKYISSITDIDIPNRVTGPSTNRPSGIYGGFMYYDTTLNKPIWWNGSNWVDATGTTV